MKLKQIHQNKEHTGFRPFLAFAEDLNKLKSRLDLKEELERERRKGRPPAFHQHQNKQS